MTIFNTKLNNADLNRALFSTTSRLRTESEDEEGIDEVGISTKERFARLRITSFV